MKQYSDIEILNVGTGVDMTIAEFAQLVAQVFGYRGVIQFDPTRPDGAPQKLLDVSRLATLGWRARTLVGEGIAAAYADFLAQGGRIVDAHLRSERPAGSEGAEIERRSSGNFRP